MNRPIHITTALFICGAISIAALSGCAKHTKKLPESRTRSTMAESSFAAGAGRAPTAATSYSFAKILISQGRDRDALYVLSNIIREHPKYIPAYNEMAGVYMRADRLDDAIAALTSGLEQSPNDAVLHNNLGMCYLLKEDAEKALEAFTSATEAVPTNPTFRANRAAALALTARESEAEREYSTVLGKLQTRENLLVLARARATTGPSDEDQSKVAPESNVKSDPDGAKVPAPKTE
ncbi:MAG: tetratricopeptide repeat protein [Tepidisphaeraceae bacterium]